MAIREDKIGQSWLFPPSIIDLIPVDHICHLIVALIAGIDVRGIEEKFMSGPGNSAYPRRMLLRLLVQAAVDGVWSSRRIEKLVYENVIYMYLAGNERPDFRTICNFRRENKELIEKVFKKTVVIAKAMGILRLGHLSTDGTKIKANASNSFTLSKEELKMIRDIIEKGIKVDEEEDGLYGDCRGDLLPPEYDSKEKIRKKIEEIESASGKKMKRAAKKIIEQHAFGDEKQKKKIEGKVRKAEEEIDKSGQKAVSLSDPESRFMENKKKRKELSYNPQITADHTSGIIVANDVTQDCTDHGQLEPMMDQTMVNLGGLPEKVAMSWDNGYYNGPNLRFLERRGMDGYIPDSKQAQRMKGKKRSDGSYTKDDFSYDEQNDQFICPQGRILTRKGTYQYGDRSLYLYHGIHCSDCPVHEECAGEKKYRVISSDGFDGERRRMRVKLESEEGRKEYKKRGETVEWPFGNVKQNLGLREFLTRGLENVKGEHNLVCSAHNLKILWKKLGKKTMILKRIRNVQDHFPSATAV